MESKEFQSVGASQVAGSTDNGKERVEPGRAMGSTESKSHPVAGSSNVAILGSADTGNLKIDMETGSLESSGLAVDADLKATVNSLRSSKAQDSEMGAGKVKRAAISEDFAILEEPHRGVTLFANSKIASEELGYESPSAQESITPPGEASNTHGMISTYMDPELYRAAATTGDVRTFEGALGDAERRLIEKVTPRGNSVLHLAASFGHDTIVEYILPKYPHLVELKNYKGDLPLHVAASAGHLAVVKSLVSFAQNSAYREGPKTVATNLMWRMNEQGNTPLHMALENGQLETALFLVQADPQVSYCLNKEGNSPFYMATKSAHLKIVGSMATKIPSRLDSYNQCKEVEQKAGFTKRNGLKPEEPGVSRHYYPKGCQLLHASIIGRNKDVMDRIWSVDASLIYSTDEEGRTPLSLAASIGFVDGVCYILDKSTDSIYLRDPNGFFPIHWACTGGHIEIIDAFLRRCPDSVELLNGQGENILHVAAKNGRAKSVSWMLKLSELEMLINEKDEKGFTPLHWATFNCHPKVVSTLTWDKRVNLEIMNKKGLTAMDIAEERIHSDAPFRGRLTRTALKSANAPRSQEADKRRKVMMASGQHRPKIDPDTQRVDTLLLVATLVATVTFACGFTLPGGINNSDPDSGMATMVARGAFQAFLICNTTALYSSIIVAVTLVWAQLGDLSLIINVLRIAVPLLGVALIAMSVAFVSGVCLVVSDHRWLAILVLIMGSISTAIISAAIFLLCLPLSSKGKFMRYLMYYPMELMIIVTRSDVEKLIKV